MIRLLPLLGLAACACQEETRRDEGTSTRDTSPPVIDTGSPPTPGVGVAIEEGLERVCPEPSLRLSAPFDIEEIPAEPDKASWFWGGGAIVADFTGDDVLDLVLPGYHGTTFHIGQEEGPFVADERLDALELIWASGGSAADYDGDGDQDLLITRYLMSDRLLRNDGGRFVDVSAEAGMAGALARSMSSSWADYDGDGDLDLFIGSYGFIDESGIDHTDFLPADPSFLYENDGDGSFTNRSDRIPQSVHDGYTFAASWMDLDRDGLPELYVVNDFGVAYPNALLWNQGAGQLVLDDGAAGLGLEITGMGLAIGDVNMDGQLDFVMPEWNGIVVVESSELGTWLRTGFARGIYNDIEKNQKVGWGADWLDIDNDRDLDLAVAFGYLDTELYDAPIEERDALFIQDDEGAFVDRAQAYGFDAPTDGRGFVVADLDDDGWLDVVLRDLQGPTRVYRARCGDDAWVKLRLVQDGSNGFAIGAMVRVFAGGDRMLRQVRAGGNNHASGGPPELHVGLGDATVIERVEITWPDGAVSNLWELPVNRTLILRRQPG